MYVYVSLKVPDYVLALYHLRMLLDVSLKAEFRLSEVLSLGRIRELNSEAKWLCFCPLLLLCICFIPWELAIVTGFSPSVMTH